MLKRAKSFTPLAVALLCLVSFLGSSMAGEIRDDAKYFSRDAVNKAKETIKNIKAETGKDVVVETYDGIPADLRANFQKSDRSKFYKFWSEQRARELKLDGILVMVVREKMEDMAEGKRPSSQIQIEVGSKTDKAGFNESDQKELTDLLLKRFGNKDFDSGLTQGLVLIQDQVKKNLGLGGKIKAGVNEAVKDAKEGELTVGSIILYALLVLVGLWLVFGLLRAFTRPQAMMRQPQQPYDNQTGGPVVMAPEPRRGPFGPANYPPPQQYPQGQYPQGNYPPQGYPPQRRGGLMGPILGGLFGAAAGSWMYDKFIRGGGGFGGGGESPGGGWFGGGQSQGDTDYRSSGGSFNEDTSVAGGSGGSFDEGDFGSGGSDFGSSGGDFGGDAGGGFDGGGGDGSDL